MHLSAVASERQLGTHARIEIGAVGAARDGDAERREIAKVERPVDKDVLRLLPRARARVCRGRLNLLQRVHGGARVLVLRMHVHLLLRMRMRMLARKEGNGNIASLRLLLSLDLGIAVGLA